MNAGSTAATIRRGLAVIATLSIGTHGGTAYADGDAAGVELAARLAYGLPFGDVQTRKGFAGSSVRDPLDQTVSGEIPIWIDAGYRFGPRWFGGIFLAYAPGTLGDALDRACGYARTACSVYDLRAGLDVPFHIRPEGGWDPWIGAGFGYEWLHVGFGGGGDPLWASGFELVNLQGGLDARLSSQIALGPFLALTAAEYAWNDTVPSPKTFEHPALHAWLVVGVRATFDVAPRGPTRSP